MDKRPVDAVVISDVHLGTYGCRAKELVNYLGSISPNILILNGDIIDGWQFSKRYFPSAHMGVIKEILQLMTRGTRVFYITGNHDELLRKYTDFQLSNFTLSDKLVLEINSKMTWIFHGDVFDHTTKRSAKFVAKLGSTGYGLLILFNSFLNRMSKLVGRDRVSLSKSIMNGVDKAVSKISDFEVTAAELAIKKKYDYVICGHIHQPQKRVFKNEHGSVIYLNSGDWVEHLTALEYINNDWSIYHYNEAQLEQKPTDFRARNLEVVTDEINFFINSLKM